MLAVYYYLCNPYFQKKDKKDTTALNSESSQQQFSKITLISQQLILYIKSREQTIPHLITSYMDPLTATQLDIEILNKKKNYILIQ